MWMSKAPDVRSMALDLLRGVLTNSVDFALGPRGAVQDT